MTQSSSAKLRTRREVLRRRRRERQIMLFGVLTIAVGAVTFAAMAVYSGETEGPFSEPFITPAGGFDSDVRLVCPPPDSFPMETDQVVVRVLNGSDVPGVAGRVRTTLDGRGFYTVGAANWSRSYKEKVRIMFGELGVHQAYTLGTHFEGVELVLDNRTNATVDIVLGAEFDESSDIRGLLASQLQPESQLTANGQCLPVHLVIAEPAPRIVPADPLAPSVTPSPEPDDEFDPDATD